MQPITQQEVAQRRKRGTELKRTRYAADGLADVHCAVLSTFNLDLLPPFLMEAMERQGLYAHVGLGAFGQAAQEVLDPNGALYRAKPENILVVLAVEDLLAPIYSAPAEFTTEEAEALAEEQVGTWRMLLSTLLDRLPDATCYVVVHGSDQVPASHVLDPRAPARAQGPVEHVLRAIRRFGELSSRVVVVDWDWHVRGVGAAAFRDERLWYVGRMRLNMPGLAALADLVAQHVAAFRGTASKVAVVDLDNTIWGGIVGEDGVKGLTLGNEGVGLAFQDFQRELLKLHHTGVLLAACSKNNPADAWAVFDRHPGMVLKREHLVAARINWQDKGSNLVELAQELNLGLDSFVFFDDNPAERDWIRQALPQVRVPEMPADPVYYPSFLRGLPYFRNITVTQADAQRAETYKHQQLRRQLEEEAPSYQEFLASLEQEITIERVHEATLSRAAQMCQRTNQFNLTTRRYTVADLEGTMGDAMTEAYTVAVKDRFGDSGITGLGILRWREDRAVIDTFLLSCRVLGRGVEDTLLAFLISRARERGADVLQGTYYPTPKNAQVATFYPDRGFKEVDNGVYELDLTTEQETIPSAIKQEVTNDA